MPDIDIQESNSPLAIDPINHLLAVFIPGNNQPQSQSPNDVVKAVTQVFTQAEKTKLAGLVSGAIVTSGTTLPTGGKEGDLYLRVDPSNELISIHRRTATTWSSFTIPQGSTGGISFTVGTADPTGGSPGDLYIKVNGSNVIQSIHRRGSTSWSSFTLPTGGSGLTPEDRTKIDGIATGANRVLPYKIGNIYRRQASTTPPNKPADDTGTATSAGITVAPPGWQLTRPEATQALPNVYDCHVYGYDINGTFTWQFGVPNRTDRFIQASGGGENNVQSDWNETDTTSDAFIQNKPTIPTPRTNAEIDGRIDAKVPPSTVGRIPSANPGNEKVWKTDGSGNPGWRDDETGGGGGVATNDTITGDGSTGDPLGVALGAPVHVPVRVLWSTSTPTPALLDGMDVTVGQSGSYFDMPYSPAGELQDALIVWVGIASDRVADITLPGFDLFDGIFTKSSGTSITVNGVAGTVWASSALSAVDVAGIEGTQILVRLTALTVPGQIDSEIDRKTAHRLIPSGGTNGQVLQKNGSNNYDVGWGDKAQLGRDVITIRSKTKVINNGAKVNLPAITSWPDGFTKLSDFDDINIIVDVQSGTNQKGHNELRLHFPDTPDGVATQTFLVSRTDDSSTGDLPTSPAQTVVSVDIDNDGSARASGFGAIIGNNDAQVWIEIQGINYTSAVRQVFNGTVKHTLIDNKNVWNGPGGTNDATRLVTATPTFPSGYDSLDDYDLIVLEANLINGTSTGQDSRSWEPKTGIHSPPQMWMRLPAVADDSAANTIRTGYFDVDNNGNVKLGWKNFNAGDRVSVTMTGYKYNVVTDGASGAAGLSQSDVEALIAAHTANRDAHHPYTQKTYDETVIFIQSSSEITNTNRPVGAQYNGTTFSNLGSWNTATPAPVAGQNIYAMSIRANLIGNTGWVVSFGNVIRIYEGVVRQPFSIRYLNEQGNASDTLDPTHHYQQIYDAASNTYSQPIPIEGRASVGLHLIAQQDLPVSGTATFGPTIATARTLFSDFPMMLVKVQLRSGNIILREESFPLPTADINPVSVADQNNARAQRMLLVAVNSPFDVSAPRWIQSAIIDGNTTRQRHPLGYSRRYLMNFVRQDNDPAGQTVRAFSSINVAEHDSGTFPCQVRFLLYGVQ